jgi:hypothetical protein
MGALDDMNTLLDQFWGSTILRISLSPDLALLTLDAQIVDSSVEPPTQEHRIYFKDVSSLKYARSTPLPWNYTELTGIEAQCMDSGI